MVAPSRGAGAKSTQRYPERAHEETSGGRLVSFFAPDGPHNRHVVLRAKERIAWRAGTARILRTGQGMLPDETTLCRHLLDARGLRRAAHDRQHTLSQALLGFARPLQHHAAERAAHAGRRGDGWRLLGVPSAFEIGLQRLPLDLPVDEPDGHGACRSPPATGRRCSGASLVEGEPCRFLVFGHIVLGERELDHAGRIEIDAADKRFAFRPDPASLWGQHYPTRVYIMVTSTPEAVEAIGGDELLYADRPLARRRLRRAADAHDQ